MLKTRTQKSAWDEHLVRKVKKLRWTSREFQLTIMPISMKFNLYLFKEDKRQAFQIDGRFASYLKEDLQKKYSNKTDEQILQMLTKFIQNITGFSDVILYDYKYGILVVRQSTFLTVLGNKTLDDFYRMKESKQTKYIGKLLKIPCSIHDWDLKNNHQIAIEVNNEDFIVYMCDDKEIEKTSNVALQSFLMYRDEVENYNKTVKDDNNKIFSIWFTIRCKSEDGGRYRHQTRQEKEDEEDFAAFLEGMDEEDEI